MVSRFSLRLGSRQCRIPESAGRRRKAKTKMANETVKMQAGERGARVTAAETRALRKYREIVRAFLLGPTAPAEPLLANLVAEIERELDESRDHECSICRSRHGSEVRHVCE